MGGRVGLGDLQRSLPAQSVLCFCDSMFCLLKAEAESFAFLNKTRWFFLMICCAMY